MVGTVGVGGGGTAGVFIVRLGGLCAGTLARTVWVLAHADTGLNAGE